VFFVWYRTVIDFAAIIIFKTFIFIYKDQFRINLSLNALISYFSGYLVLQPSSSLVLCQQSGAECSHGTFALGLLSTYWHCLLQRLDTSWWRHGALFSTSLAVFDACWLEVWNLFFFLLFIKTDGVLWFIIKNEL